jgi:hypothetical protein
MKGWPSFLNANLRHPRISFIQLGGHRFGELNYLAIWDANENELQCHSFERNEFNQDTTQTYANTNQFNFFEYCYSSFVRRYILFTYRAVRLQTGA